MRTASVKESGVLDLVLRSRSTTPSPAVPLKAWTHLVSKCMFLITNSFFGINIRVDKTLGRSN